MERIRYFKPVTKTINLMFIENGPAVLGQVLKSILLQWEYKIELLGRILKDSDTSQEDIAVIEGVATNFHISKDALFDMGLDNPDNAEEWVLQLVSAADCLSAYHELVTHSCGKYEIHKALTPLYLLAVYIDIPLYTDKDIDLYQYVTRMIADIFPEQRVIFASDLWNHIE